MRGLRPDGNISPRRQAWGMHHRDQQDGVMSQEQPSAVWMDEQAIGTLGWVLIVILVLVFLGVIGFSFNA